MIRVADCPWEDYGDVSDYEDKRRARRGDLAFWLTILRSDKRRIRRGEEVDLHAMAIARMAIDNRRNRLRVMDTGLSSTAWWLKHHKTPDFIMDAKYGKQ